jgi:hypothetical protein
MIKEEFKKKQKKKKKCKDRRSVSFTKLMILKKDIFLTEVVSFLILLYCATAFSPSSASNAIPAVPTSGKYPGAVLPCRDGVEGGGGGGMGM